MKISLKLLGAVTLVILACCSIAASSKRYEYQGNPDPDNTQQAIMIAQNPNKTLLVINAIAMSSAALGLFAWVLEDIELQSVAAQSVTAKDYQASSLTDKPQTSEPEEETFSTKNTTSQPTASALPEDLLRHLQHYTNLTANQQQEDSQDSESPKEESPMDSETDLPLTESELLKSIGQPRI
ncbi:MAG: hypothetical protein F6J89_02000 [Symploca sp. SIO1C4]|uniref:Uncharacterized protein n=1 Tax=Symploca sp. SIO1C4 TaxID=2607765 RepID=A0A6B3N4H9_9CYAN|nr:hypothetical protein [Symploca sp. SIO1C4]